jgi:hypothetical protein
VVFYLAYILEHLLCVDLRRGLEVCGMLAAIYVSRNLNVRGHIFGFVNFIKVCHVKKLNKALNNVFFWDNCLFTKVTKFDRFGNNVRSGGGLGEGEKVLERREKKMAMLEWVGWLSVLWRWLELRGEVRTLVWLSKEYLMLVSCRGRKRRRRYILIEI